MHISQHNHSVKTSLNLDLAVKEKIDELVRKKLIKNQTEFINHALEKSLEDLEKEITLQNLRKKMKNIKKIKPIISSNKALETLREES